MRLFVALPVPEPLVEALEVVQASLPKGLRPVSAADFHVTLAFLGDVGRSETEDLIAAVEGLTGDPVELQVTGISTFGAGDETRSVHASVAANPELIARQREILGIVRAIGIR
ncbi:MAG: RNA 2',3'-cyclic phosphodiesterase, partial [Pseudomonadota bacterium]